MKFLSFQLISLLTATVSFSFPTLFGDDLPNPYGEFSEGCLSVSKQYEECYTEVTLSNMATTCTTFNSEKCQNFKKNGFLLAFNECKSEPQEKVILANDIIEAMYIDAKFRCTNDENGNLCPINKYELESKGRNDYDQKVKDTCKSKACSDAYVEYVNEFDIKLDIIEEKVEKEFEKKLDSELNEMKNEMKNKTKSEIDEMKNEMKKEIEDTKNGKLVKRFLTKLDFSSTSRRDYLISNNCSDIPAKNVSSDATVAQRLNIFAVVVIVIVATIF